MAAPSPASIATAERVSALLPRLVENLNAEERLPWIEGLGVDDFTVESIAAGLVATTAWEAAAGGAKRALEGRPLRADWAGPKAHVLFLAASRSAPLFAYVYRRDPAAGALGIARMMVGDDGAIEKIIRVADPLDDKLSRPMHVSLAATRLLADAADPGDDPARRPSGISAHGINGVTVYEYKDALDSDTEHQGTPVQITPRALPRVKADLAKELKAFGPRFQMDEGAAAYWRETGAQIDDSQEQWWVSEDMAQLAWDVTVSGTGPEDLSEAELPAPSGIMWLNGGGGPALLTKRFPDERFYETRETASELLSINAIVWYTPKSSHGIRGLEPGVTRFLGLSASPGLARDTTGWGGLLSPADIESDLIESFRMPTYVTTGMLKGLPRTMALIVMRLAREESLGQGVPEQVVPFGGGKKAKGKKAKPEPATITVASLRRRRYESEGEREAESREYSHRWIVRGHMRNQPVGPRNAEGGQQHARVWIAPHVKGPEDKPLVLKDRVQVWKR